MDLISLCSPERPTIDRLALMSMLYMPTQVMDSLMVIMSMNMVAEVAPLLPQLSMLECLQDIAH